jgi:TatD DNase family protein
MVETDAPFLTPEPHRTVRPNEPRFVVHVAHALADLWSRDRHEVAAVLDANARRFFSIAPDTNGTAP